MHSTYRRLTLGAIAAAMATMALLPATDALAADKVKIGFLSTLSGPGAAIGIDIRDGFNLAYKHAGEKVGGLPAEIIIADDLQTPEGAKQAADRMIKRDKVDFMTGIVFSNLMLAVGPSVFDSKTFYVSANAGPSQYAGERCSPYYFNVAWQNDNQHEAVGKTVMDKGFKKVALLAPNYPAGKDALTGFKRFYKGTISEEIYTRINQPDYSAELAQIRASKPDALYIFMPGGMGINFIKQFVGTGMSKDMQLFAPGFGADEDVIGAVGDPMLGTFNASQWAFDLDNAANKKFVADFRTDFKRTPSVYASQGYNAFMLIDGAVRDLKGKLDNKAAVEKALEAANFKSVNGGTFKFNTNHHPIQDYYLRVVSKGADGKVTNRLLNKVFENHADAYVGQCKMAKL